MIIEAVLQGRNLDDVLPVLEQLGGDLRLLDDGDATILELRLHRDGRPESATVVVRPDEAWPDGPDDIAVDFHDSGCAPARFKELVGRCAEARQLDRTVHFLNTPGHLRLYLEILEADHLLPKRPVSGPRLPEVLTELWRHG